MSRKVKTFLHLTRKLMGAIDRNYLYLFRVKMAGIENERSLMLTEKIRGCTWEQFEEIIRKTIDSDFIWNIRPGDTEANRQAVMESVERMLREHNGRFPEEGDMFIERVKSKAVP